MNRTTTEPTLIDATCCIAYLEGFLNVLKAVHPEIDITPGMQRIHETLPDVFAKKADARAAKQPAEPVSA